MEMLTPCSEEDPDGEAMTEEEVDKYKLRAPEVTMVNSLCYLV